MKRCSTILTTLAAISILLVPYTRTSAASQRPDYLVDLGVAQSAGIAMTEYADHHHGRLPKSTNWEESIKPYWPDKDFTTSIKEHPGNELAMNSKLSGAKLSQISPDSSIVLYEIHSQVKDASGLSPWKQCQQCRNSTQGWRMIVFGNDWACSCVEGSDIVFVHRK